MFPLTDHTRTRRRPLTCVWRVLCLVLCLALLTVSFPATESTVYATPSLDELHSQKEDYAAKEQELAAQRDETAQTLEEQKAQNEILRQQIEAKSAEIGVNEQLMAQLDARIAEKNTRIAEQEQQIATLEETIDATYALLQKRLRELSKKNSFFTIIQLILDSDSYNDYLISLKISERISQRDEKLMAQLEADMIAIEETRNQNLNDKAALEIELTQLAKVHADMESAKGSLQTLYNEQAALEAEMSKNVEYLDAKIAEMQAMQAHLQSTINDVMEQIRAEEEERRRQEEEEKRRQEEEEQKRQEEENGDSDTPSDEPDSGNDDDDDSQIGGGYEPPVAGAMIWPAPTCRVVTSSFGYREGYDSDFHHGGMDIARYGSAHGHEIVAVADGVVRYANRYDTWGMGFGLFMIIDHGYDAYGQRILTTYAHCSEVVVYEGMEVSAGDTIGYIGNTGASDGAHLHIEVDVDGVAVDPAAYLPMDGVDILG